MGAERDEARAHDGFSDSNVDGGTDANSTGAVSTGAVSTETVSTNTVAIGLNVAPLESRFAEFGTFLLDSGHSVTDTRDTLEAVQRTHAPDAKLSFAVLPEAVFVGRNAGAAPAAMGISAAPFSMTQSAAANRLTRALRFGEVGLDTATRRSRSIRLMTPRFQFLRTVLGSALLAIGLAVLFRCPWWAIAFCAITGAVVGALIAFASKVGTASSILPFLAAFVSTGLVGVAAHLFDLGEVPLFAVCSPVAILVPGALITNALLELTASDIVTGAARLVSGVVLLGFMAAGIIAGAAVTGLRLDPGSVALVGEISSASTSAVGWFALPPFWAGWGGVVLVAVGIGLAFGADRRLLPVTVLTMACTYMLLTALGPVTGSIFATGATAMILFVASRLLEGMPSGIPSAVSFQPAFLLLVPGTIGLVALTSQDPESLSSTPLTFVSLCIGTKVGAAISDAAKQLQERRQVR